MSILVRVVLRTILVGAFVLGLGLPALAQTARVQFIHASPYGEAAVVDVYRNGELWLDDFSRVDATPFADWPEGTTFRIDVTWPDAVDNQSPVFSETLALTPGERYILFIAGDPLGRPEEPPFALFTMAGAHEISPFGELGVYRHFTTTPDFRWSPYIRGGYVNMEDSTSRVILLEMESHGSMMPRYLPSPPHQFEIDVRGADSRILFSALSDFTGTEGLPVAHFTTGFLNPRRPKDMSHRSFVVFPDGTVRPDPLLVARAQFVHNSPYSESGVVDIAVTLLDPIGPDHIVLNVDDLSFRESTPFVDLPSGRMLVGEQATAPDLRIEVTTADGSDTLLTDTVRLLFRETYVVALVGDPLTRDGQPAMDLKWFEGWREAASRGGEVDVLFGHGAPDLTTANLGVEGDMLPLAGYVPFGGFAPLGPRPARDDTLYVAHADAREIIARFGPEFQSRGLSDSAVVVLASGFVEPPEGIAAEGSDFALVEATPSGGPMHTFTKWPPPPWWQNPWVWVLGLLGLSLVALVGFQVRIFRLRARERELGALVEERTRELRLEKEKTEEQAQRLVELDEAKNRFFANISHEFRTPLTLILGPLQDAIDGAYGAVSPRLTPQLRLMRRNSRRLLRLVNQLLDLSRLESGKMKLNPEPGDLSSFTRSLTRAFVPLAERRRIQLTFDAGIDSLPMEFDPDAMEKTLSNLISNALKFTPEGGKVLVGLSTVNVDGASYADVYVKDTGPGINEEDLHRIFDRFQQADTSIRRAYEGSGIGLTLAKELAELHGGELLVESALGFGSMFTVRLPLPEMVPKSLEATGAPYKVSRPDVPVLEEAAFAASGDGAPTPTVGDEGRATILVVEDNADVRAYLRDHLQARYDVLEAEDGELGLEAVLTHRPDLILADVMMPNMDGYEMCRLIKANDDLRHIPVVMLTAKAGEGATVEGLQSGADDYLAKPFNFPELDARLSNLIGSRREMRARFSREIFVRPGEVSITPEDEAFLDRLLEAIETHIADGYLTLEWLADDLGVSRRHLTRRVEDVTGESPASLIRRLRLERASQLLRAGAGTISEIGYAVGFKSPAQFSRAFKEAYGETPSEHMRVVE